MNPIFLAVHATEPAVSRDHDMIHLYPTGDVQIAVMMTLAQARKAAAAMVRLLEDGDRPTTPEDVRDRIETLTGFAPMTVTLLGRDGVDLMVTNLELRRGPMIGPPSVYAATEADALMDLWQQIETLQPGDAVVVGADGLHGQRREVRWRNGAWVAA
jgi:hypothetical protein